MSVVLEAAYEGETFEVEVFHDGHIEFPGRDLEYEQSMSEFVEAESPVVKLHRVWKEDPSRIILDYLWVVEENKSLLAADHAEHVLHIYEHECRGDLRPREAIEALRRFVNGEIDLSTMERMLNEVFAARDALQETKRAAKAAVRAATAAVWDALWEAMMLPTRSARLAASAVAWSVSSDPDSAVWHQAYNAEIAWQIRRFVDVMEALGQDLPWPPLEVTP